MLPLVLAAGTIWTYNIARFIQLSNRRNSIKKKDENEEKNLTVFLNCNFHYEDNRIYNNYNNCTFNIYIAGRRRDE